MEMFHRASLKLGLTEAVVDKATFATHHRFANSKKNASGPKSAKEVDNLLKRGAYDVFGDDDGGAEAKAFCEADIEEILTNRAVTLTQGGVKGGGAFHDEEREG